MDTGGKSAAPAEGFRNGGLGVGQGNGNLINVQPPRREDLQPAYAQTLQGESEDAGTHGWYGSMSMIVPFPHVRLIDQLTTDQSTRSVRALASWEPSLAAVSVRIHTNPSTRGTLVL